MSRSSEPARFREVPNPAEQATEWDSGWRYALCVASAGVLWGLLALNISIVLQILIGASECVATTGN